MIPLSRMARGFHLIVTNLAILSVAAVMAAPADAPKIKVLIVDGQNNHQWANTTPLLKKILEDTGRFTVDGSTSPPAKPSPPRLARDATPAQKSVHEEKLKTHATVETEFRAKSTDLWKNWRPMFAHFDVVVSNYNGETWPEGARAAFVAYVKNGGGFVSYHAANNAFPEWAEYNEMIGLGGWGDRTEKSGPYLRLRDGAWIKDLTAGIGGSHGPQHEFIVEVRDPEHPITRGLPAKWKHAKDELYDRLRGPAVGVTVLASAFSDKTQEHEPVLMVIPYGKGRVFHTTLGHAVDAVNGLGFQTTFARGTEWAATGKVTLPSPNPAELTAERAALREVK
jgi:uncharacterized protein